MAWTISEAFVIVSLSSVPFWIAFLIGETRRRLRVGYWR